MGKRKFKRKQKKILAFLTFVVLVASVAALMLLTPAFNIKEVNVYGNSVLESADIKRASGIVEGVSIFGVSLREAEENVLSMGYVESVKIKRRLPGTIDITIVEEVGVAYIKAKEGFVIISADGRCIDITDGMSEENGSIKVPSLPIVTGLREVKYKVGKPLKSEDEEQLEALCTCLHEFSKEGYVLNMREIDMSDTDKIKFYYRSRKLCVNIGSTKEIDYKMQSFIAILKELGDNPTGNIDLRYDKAFYTPYTEDKKSEDGDKNESNEE